MSDAIIIKTQFNCDYVPISTEPRVLYLLIEIQPESKVPLERLPLNLGIVVDDSESMNIPLITDEQFKMLQSRGQIRDVIKDGIKVWEFQNVSEEYFKDYPRCIDFVKTALRQLVRRLTPNDYFCLVSFASQAEVLIPQKSAKDKEGLLSFIDYLGQRKLGDETEIGKGLSLVLQEIVSQSSPNVVNRVILLTDGFSPDLERCKVLATQAAGTGLPITTIGVSGEFNETLLTSISASSRGNSYFAAHPEDIEGIFNEEFQNIQSIILSNLVLTLEIQAGIKIRRAHRVSPEICLLEVKQLDTGLFRIKLGNISKVPPSAILLELLVPSNREEEQFRLGDLTISYDMPTVKLYRQAKQLPLTISYTSNSLLYNKKNYQVMNIIEKVSAFDLQARAWEDAQKGDTLAATRRLKRLTKRLQNIGEIELANQVQLEAQRLKKHGWKSDTGTKKIHYETRKLTLKCNIKQP